MTTPPVKSVRSGITVVGEALIDIVIDADGTRSESIGGRQATVARGLGRLGMPITLLTNFGDDQQGRAIDHELTRCGVRVVRPGLPAHTSTITAYYDRPGTESVDLCWEFAHTHLPPGEHVHVGSLAVVQDPGAEDVVRLVESLHPDTTLSYDVAVRHSAMGPWDGAVDRIDTMISRSDIVKLSDEDLAWLRPGDRTGEAIRWLMSRGPAILVLTHGDTGATAYTRSGSVRVRGRRIEVADAADREDAFMAGLLHAMNDSHLLVRTPDRQRLRAIDLGGLRAILNDAYRYASWIIEDRYAVGIITDRTAAGRISSGGTCPPRSDALAV